MQDLYIISRKRVTYLEDKHIKWIYLFKNVNDYKEIIKHFKEFGARYEIPK